MKLLGISVGQPRKVQWQKREILTSIFKSPISGPVQVKRLNIEGDHQADLNVHGGVDKAVYAYSHDTYPWWQKELGLADLPFGALGENLTFDQLDETQIFVGDVFELGSCRLQAVQPRAPCFKLGIRYNDQKIIQTFTDFNRSGIYFRVIQEGIIQPGNTLKLVASETIKASIGELFNFMKDRNSVSKARAAELVKISGLNERMRKKFESMSQE